MGDKTGISWTDATWNPMRGCSRVSAGCQNCYAERIATRFSGPGKPYDGLIKLIGKRHASGAAQTGARGRWNGNVMFVGAHLSKPLAWTRPRRIFVNSMTDVFHDGFTNEQIAAVFGIMARAPRHTFQVLTKRAKRMREWFEWVSAHSDERGPAEWCVDFAYRELVAAGESAWSSFVLDQYHLPTAWPLPNVWQGVSVEDQPSADERIPELERTPARVHFLSCEPLLGEVTMPKNLTRPFGIEWVIVGCESGPGARRCDVTWIRSLLRQCRALDIPFFLKQAREQSEAVMDGDGSKRKSGRVIELPYLDGVQHARFPCH